MKSFKTYLMENETSYQFRIKLADKLEDDTVERLETALEKYELKSLSKPKKTPIQEHPMDFQTLTNAEVYIMDAEVVYPTTAHHLYHYLTEYLGIPHSHLVVINRNHPEEIAREESLEASEEYVTKLTDSEYSEAEDVKSEDLYGDKYNENFLKSLETRKYEFAKEEK